MLYFDNIQANLQKGGNTNAVCDPPTSTIFQKMVNRLAFRQSTVGIFLVETSLLRLL